MAEIGAAGGHGNGRSIQNRMALIANLGSMNGKQLLSDKPQDN